MAVSEPYLGNLNIIVVQIGGELVGHHAAGIDQTGLLAASQEIAVDFQGASDESIYGKRHY